MASYPEFFRQFCLFFLTPKCYDEFFVEFNFLEVECLKGALSKGLGYGIITGSMLVKIPQILKIWSKRNAVGINIISVSLELCAITANAAYAYRNKFPFSAWGEGLFLAYQTSIIGGLTLYLGAKHSDSRKYQPPRKIAGVLYICFHSLIYCFLLYGPAPMDLLWALQAANVPLILAGKTIQAISNYKAKSTGQLSAITIFMLFAGSLARIFTSVQETGDMTLVITYIVSSFANGMIAAQVIYYWPKSKASNKSSVNKRQQKREKSSKKSQ